MKSRLLDPAPLPPKIRVAWYGSLLLLAAVLGFSLGVEPMGERLKDKIIERVERTFNVTLEAESGDWSLDGSVTLKGLKIRAKDTPPNEPPLLIADAIDIQGDVELLARRVRLVSVGMNGVQVHITRRPDGSTNIAGVLKGLSRFSRPKKKKKKGAKKNPLGFLKRSVPKVSISELDVTFDIDGEIPGIGRLGRAFVLKNGELSLENTAVVKEDDRADLELRFARTSLTPKSGLVLNAEVSLKSGLREASLSFDSPIVLPLGRRSLSIGGISFQRSKKHSVASIDRLKFTSGDQPQGRIESIEISAIRAVLDPKKGLTEIAKTLRKHGATRAGLAGLKKLNIMRPSFAFQTHDLGAEIRELRLRLKKMSQPSPSDTGPDKALGVLMEASRAAAERFTQGKKGGGPLLKKSLNAYWGKARDALNTLAPALSKLMHRLPINKVSLSEGIFTWQGQGEHSEPHALSHRFENFGLEFERTPDNTSVLDVRFVVPGTTEDANSIRVTTDEMSGHLQLDLKLKDLPLFPYRHVFPAALPLSEKTGMRDTDFTLIWSPQTGIAKVFGKAKAMGMTLSAPRLAEGLLTNMRLEGTFDATLDLKSNAISLHKSSFRLGSIRANVHGSLTQLATAPIVEGALQLERIRCQEIVDSLPKAFIPHLKSMKVGGTFGALINFRLDTADIEGLTYEIFPALHGFTITDTGVLDFEAVRGTFTHRLQEADGTMREFQAGPDAPHWVSLDEISKYMPKAITTTEDGSFFRHNGFSSYAIRRSIITNLQKGGFYRGASTVSQQLVKNLFLSRAKTISRKLQEMFITWRLEKILSKKRIMELYLNVIELGPGIYGIKHAARHYFDKHPSELSLLECVFIASLIPSPNRYYKQFARGEVTPGWRRYLRTLIGIMRQRDKISQAEYAAAAPYSPMFRGQKPPESDDEDVPEPPIIPWKEEAPTP